MKITDLYEFEQVAVCKGCCQALPFRNNLEFGVKCCSDAGSDIHIENGKYVCKNKEGK